MTIITEEEEAEECNSLLNPEIPKQNLKTHYLKQNIITIMSLVCIILLVLLKFSLVSSCLSHNKILITGINGLIGSHIASAILSNKDYDHCDIIYGLVRFNSRLDNLKGILNQITLVKGDITDSHRMNQIIKTIQPTIIYHLSAQAINGVSFENPSLTLRVNIDGTLNILEALKNNGLYHTRFIFAGSSTEYGKSANTKQPLNENTRLQPITPYGVSKTSGELLSLQYFYTFNIPVIILRFFIQIGVGGTDSLSIQQFCKQIAQIEKGIHPPILYHGNLNSIRDISDVRDMSPVIIHISEHGIPGEIYNIGTGEGIETRQLLLEAVRQSKVDNIELRADPSLFRLADEEILIADVSKVRKLIDIPKLNITKTIASILQDWRQRV